MNQSYENMKKFAREASDENLKFAFLALDKIIEKADLPETLAYTVVTAELEERGLLVFDEVNFEYKLIG